MTNLLLLLLLLTTRATEEQCQIDCRSPIAQRLVGPTRPWHPNDDLGNTLKLTRPHPYSIAAGEITVLAMNVTLRLDMPKFDKNRHGFGEVERSFVKNALEGILSRFSSVDIRVVSDDVVDRGVSGIHFVDLILGVESIAEHNGYNATSSNDFFQSVSRTVKDSVHSGEATTSIQSYASESNVSKLHEASIDFPPDTDPDDLTFVTYKKLDDDTPTNRFSKFCELGCTLFFSTTEDTSTLRNCTDRCDDMYSYNISVGYNDLMETARLECRDGCQIALKRCRPGYYCGQVRLNRNSEKGEDVYDGGRMIPCPPGTFRDVSYDAVEQCVDCPPGRYRETIKGRDLDSCTKCPVGRYASESGNISVLRCLRCPAGRFHAEKGAQYCTCITPDACKEEELPCPADAEKRETVPFIGRW